MGSTAKVTATAVEPQDNPSAWEVRAFPVRFCSLYMLLLGATLAPGLFLDGEFRVLFF
jgi:hypothetical protein